MKPRFLKLFMISILMLSFNSCASTNHIKKPKRSDYVAFNASFMTRRPYNVENSDQTLFMVPLAIPNLSLTYLKHGKKFKADYSVDVRFFKEKILFFNKKFDDFLEVDTFKETKKDIIYLSTLKVLIAPGKYDVEIVYRSDVREAIKKCKNVEIPLYTGFSIGSLQLLHKSTLDSLPNTYVTNYHHLYIDKDSLYYITELYNVKQGTIKFKFEFIKDGKLVKTKYNEIITESAVDIYQLIPQALQIIDLAPGSYVLKTEISDTFNRYSTKTFFVIGEDIIRYSDKGWKESITLLKYMLGHGGVKHLKKSKIKKIE